MLADVAVFLAYPAVMFIVWCAGAAAALRTRNWPLLAAALLILIALAVNPILKEIVARPRPGAADLIVRRAVGGYGFPSGHTASATLLYGYAAVSLGLVTATPIRRFLVTAAGAAIVLIAFERVYDGAHWPSDVAGGSLSGMLLVCGSVALGNAIVTRMPRYRSASIPAPNHCARAGLQGPARSQPLTHTRTFSVAVDRRFR